LLKFYPCNTENTNIFANILVNENLILTGIKSDKHG
jgi:hypothetical protein